MCTLQRRHFLVTSQNYLKQWRWHTHEAQATSMIIVDLFNKIVFYLIWGAWILTSNKIIMGSCVNNPTDRAVIFLNLKYANNHVQTQVMETVTYSKESVNFYVRSRPRRRSFVFDQWWFKGFLNLTFEFQMF